MSDRIGIWNCWFLRRGENRSTWRNTSRSKGENQQQTQSTYGVDARIRTRATLVGGECSHHCATLAPQLSWVYYGLSPFRTHTRDSEGQRKLTVLRTLTIKDVNLQFRRSPQKREQSAYGSLKIRKRDLFPLSILRSVLVWPRGENRGDIENTPLRWFIFYII